MANRVNLGLLITLGLLLTTMLIGQRFGFPFAGGKGYVTHNFGTITDIVGEAELDKGGDLSVASQGTQIPRGTIIRVKEGGRVKIEFQKDANIFLDERTDIRLDSYLGSSLHLHLLQGRMTTEIVDAKLLLKTARTVTSLDEGSTSFVNYNFKETVGIMPIEGVIEISTTEEIFKTNTSWEIHETPPVTMTPIDFAPTSGGAAAEFYKWVTDLQTKTPSASF